MYQAHTDIETPPDDSTIWRYTSVDKLLALLSSRSLHLCRLDRFRDPWEGVWPKFLLDALCRGLTHSAALVQNVERLRMSFFVNCWHENREESAAFWDQYRHTSAIAIKSNVRRLREASRADQVFYVGRVQYMDYAHESLPIAYVNALTPPFLKRRSFEHEREVRLLVWDLPTKADKVDWTEGPPSRSLAVDLATLIEEVFVSPEAESWLAESIQNLFERFDLRDIPVRHSELYDRRVL